MSIFDGYSDEDVEAMQDGILFELRLQARKRQRDRLQNTPQSNGPIQQGRIGPTLEQDRQNVEPSERS